MYFYRKNNLKNTLKNKNYHNDKQVHFEFQTSDLLSIKNNNFKCEGSFYLKILKFKLVK